MGVSFFFFFTQELLTSPTGWRQGLTMMPSRDLCFIVSSLLISLCMLSFLAAGRQLTVPGLTMAWSLAHEVRGERSSQSPSEYDPWTVADGIVLAVSSPANHWGKESCQPLIGWVRGCRFLVEVEDTQSGWATWCECIGVERHVEDSQCFC